MAIERKSAAIMFTDIAGYTEAMSESEQKALDMLGRKRSILKPLIDNHQGAYDKDEILKLIKKNEHWDDYLNYFLSQLLEDTLYLETAYNQAKEKVDNLEPDVAAKFLSYPIPSAIVEAWEKIK